MSAGLVALRRTALLSRPSATVRLIVPAASLRVFPAAPPFDNSNLPEKYRLPIYPKVPTALAAPGIGVKPVRGSKELYRVLGEETIKNRLQLGQYGIVAIAGGELSHKHFEMLRNYTGKFMREGKTFAIYRVDAPYKAVTRHGVGKKLGGGKGSIHHYVTPVKAGRIILEVGGKAFWEEVQPWLSRVAKKLPFEAMAVSQDLMDRLDAEEKRLDEVNENPYSFEWLVRNNMLDCWRHLSPRDRKWFGKFLYRDRTFNFKWNTVRQIQYKSRK